MSIKLGEGVRNAMLDEVAADAAGGELRVYTGSQPANAGASATGTLLATLTLNSPAFDAASGGSMAVDVDPAITAAATADGEAGWARLVASDATTVVLDGTVGTSSADFTVNATTITTGLDVSLTGGSLSIPA